LKKGKEAKMTDKQSDKNHLTKLGGKSEPGKNLEVFPNQNPERYYLVTLETDEFTCLCPVTGQPDFATIRVEYIPDQLIVESKSFRLYIWSYRNEGVFHEHVTKTLDPHWCKVTGIFNIRGGVDITVNAQHIKTKEALDSIQYL
jgi:7-cyano-7-deazaguanine reductase